MARGDCNITNICIPTRRIIYSAGFTPPAPPPPPPPGCNFPNGSFAQGGDICDWEYRVRYDIDPAQVPSDQSNFTLKVFFEEVATDLSPGNTATFWNEISRQNIRVTSTDGSTELPHYTHALNNINETGYMSVRVPTVSGSVQTSIFIYFSNPAATEYAVGHALGRNATFQDDEAVWDYEQDPASAPPSLLDITGNGYSGTISGTPGTVAGKLGQAWRFVRASSQFVNIGNTIITGGQARTFKAWVRFTTLQSGTSGNNAQTIASFGLNNNGERWELTQTGFGNAGNNLRFEIQGAGETPTIAGLATGTDYLLTVKHTGDNINTASIHVGTTKYILSTTATINTAASSFGRLAQTLITSGTGNARFLDGNMSYSAYKIGADSDDRITTEYNNQNSPGTFATFTNFLANV